MSMLDRYKKKGGFIQLLILIETSSKSKQEQFLNLIAQENPHWEETIKKKTITLDRILSWDQTYVGEILSRVQPLTVAVAFRGFPQDKLDFIFSCFSSTDKRKIQNLISETQPSPGEILTCGMKVITEVRELMKTGVLKMEKIDPDLMIPDNIEDILNTKVSSNTVANIDEAIQETKSAKPSSSKEATVTVSGGGHENLLHEIETLKKKVLVFTNENNHLKSENAVLKSKLEQIKKIA